MRIKKGDWVRVKRPAKNVGEVGVVERIFSWNEAEVFFPERGYSTTMATIALEPDQDVVLETDYYLEAAPARRKRQGRGTSGSLVRDLFGDNHG